MSENTNTNSKQSRWKSKVLWAAVAAQVLALLQMTGLLALLGVDAGTAGDVVAGVLQLLAIVGVVNDPTNGEGW